ncbi:single-stranded DNA-binding protein [Bacillus sp. DTU_2020_1000418_1_SI_GHA_SEK_038]|uniref:single-stranded DNA-binding protein n=1 Tax=Bacillus sp. DTU_2020_1000418_1_SI_GHA_SEK_038 TaxID=3077585 RepID=UPI0028E8724A|nr:single-stranded DNA-binding protein [Bacillus sp. DTU_2020_1000418_1_SI_GHA_SEK_038]WNS74255.1 single-stranded DNA-binding protein [Bacillus sp. DTU_2020_1000418_1_SI_GHA_SEK_038]
MNNVSLVGRMTKAAELRYSPNGTPVASFTLAVNRMKKDEADFINCVCFKKTAENLANYTEKGSQISVSGSIQTRNYENSEGRKVYVTEVIANQITFLDSKKDKQQTQKYTEDPSDPFAGGQPDIEDSDLPF